jgi:uncharacterized membrane protein
MPMILPVHILAGGLALLSGYVALYAAKGASAHRRSGTLFVYAMVVMSLSGAFIAAVHDNAISVVAGLMTFYMVATGMRTVRPRGQAVAAIDRAATLFAVIVAAACFVVGMQAAGRGRPEAYPLFIFGIVGALAVRGDLRLMRQGELDGPRRIARHLWRMCFGMWVAAASFFWGPQNRVPELIRIPALQAVAVLLPIVVMIYWLRRLRKKRRAAAAVAHEPMREAFDTRLTLNLKGHAS